MWHLLIVETELGGHQADYIQHLVSFTVRQQLNIRLTFLVPPALDLEDRIQIDSDHSGNSQIPQVAYVPMQTAEYDNCTQANVIKRSFHIWYTAMRYLAELDADHVHFQHLDYVQLPLALQLKTPGRQTVSGVLFRPMSHYAELGHLLKLKEILSRFRKNITHPAILRNSCLTTMFSLDSYFVPFARRHFTHGNKVVVLPDPSLYPGARVCEPPDRDPRLSNKRTSFLLFGSLAPRKGIFKLLNAIERLSAESQRRTRFVLAGKLDASIEEEFLAAADHLRKTNPEIHLQIENRYLEQSELVDRIGECDVILAPYQRFVGSSGVILWAAGARKPAITQDFGCVGEMVKEFEMGLAVDTTDPDQIAWAIEESLTQGPANLHNPSKMSELARRHTPERFADAVFTSIMSGLRTRSS